MNKCTIFIFIALVICCFSCKNEKATPSVFEFELVKTYNIVLNENDRQLSENFSGQFQIVEIDNKNCMIVSCNDNKLVFYEIESGKKINEIFTDTTQYLNYFSYINKDSIFVFYCVLQDTTGKLYYDEQLQLIDFQGNVKQKFNYNVDTIETKNKKIDVSLYIPPQIINNSQTQITFADNQIFFAPCYQTHFLPGTKKFIENRLSMLMSYDLKAQKFSFSKQDQMPYIKEGIYYPSGSNFNNICISHNNFPLLRYFYSSNVFEWNFQKDSILTHTIKSKLIDTIMPLTEPARYANNNIDAFYTQIVYDKYREQYWAYYHFSQDFYDQFISGIIITDKNFNYLGEIYDNKYYPCNFSKDYLIDYYPLLKNDSIIEVSYLKLKKTNKNYEHYIDACRTNLKTHKKIIEQKTADKENVVINFLKKNNKTINETTILTVYALAGCIGCQDAVLSAVEKNKEQLKTKPFYLIVSANDKETCLRQIKNYDFTTFENLIIDSLGIVKNQTFVNGLQNPRLTIVSNNEIILDSIYDSFQIESGLIPTMYKSLGF